MVFLIIKSQADEVVWFAKDIKDQVVSATHHRQEQVSPLSIQICVPR